MTAKIVRLTGAKRSQIRCPETGVVFPQLFRLTGVSFKLKKGVNLQNQPFFESLDDLEPDLESPVPPSYTLDMERMHMHIASPRWEPIHTLDPKVDDGLVFVRHHSSPDRLDAYIDAVCDLEVHDRYADSRFLSFETDFGYFTILHRCANDQAVNCALVYAAKIVDPITGDQTDWNKVIGCDGKELTVDDLDPPEVQEQFAAVQEMLKSNR